MSLPAALGLFALTVANAPDARAQTPVFGNFAAPAAGVGTGFTSSLIYSARFRTGVNPVTVGSVQATLGQTFGNVAVTIGFGIYADNAGSPSAKLFSFGTQTITNPSNSQVNYTFAPGGSVTLAADTVYHLRTVSNSTTLIRWHLTDPTIAPVAQNGSLPC